MNQALPRTLQLLVSCAALPLASALTAGGCAVPAEDTSETQQANVYYVAPPTDPNLAACAAWSATLASHNPGWPNHIAGACGTAPEYTTAEAVEVCGGRKLAYFSYECSDHPAGDSAWTSYFACCCSSTTVTFQSRYLPPELFPGSTAAALTIWTGLHQAAPTSGYGDTTLFDTSKFSNHTTFPGGSHLNIASHVAVSFFVDPTQVGAWEFRLGPDYGKGGVLRLDGTECQHRWKRDFPVLDMNGHPYDFDWSGSFANVDRILTCAPTSLTTGMHVIEAFGFEDGSDEFYATYKMRLEARAPDGEWAPMIATDDTLCSGAPAVGD